MSVTQATGGCKAPTKTIRQAVFSDHEVKGCMEFLMELPRKILDAKAHIVDLEIKLKYDTTVKDAKDVMVAAENEIAFEVLNDMWAAIDCQQNRCLEKEVNKYKFTNAEQRKNESARRLANCNDWIDARNELGVALRAESVLKMDLGKVHARFAAIEAENHNLRAIAGMIAGLAHESTTITTHQHTTLVKLGEN